MDSLPESRDLQARSATSACDRQVRQRFAQILISRRQVPTRGLRVSSLLLLEAPSFCGQPILVQ